MVGSYSEYTRIYVDIERFTQTIISRTGKAASSILTPLCVKLDVTTQISHLSILRPSYRQNNEYTPVQTMRYDTMCGTPTKNRRTATAALPMKKSLSSSSSKVDILRYLERSVAAARPSISLSCARNVCYKQQIGIIRSTIHTDVFGSRKRAVSTGRGAREGIQFCLSMRIRMVTLSSVPTLPPLFQKWDSSASL